MVENKQCLIFRVNSCDHLVSLFSYFSGGGGITELLFIMKKILLLCITLGFLGVASAQTGGKQKMTAPTDGLSKKISNSRIKEPESKGGNNPLSGSYEIFKEVPSHLDDSILPLSPNGKLLSVDGYEVEFRLPDNPAIGAICGTPRPYIVGTNKSASCSFTVPCDNPANRDAASTALKYFQLEWHVMTDGGPSSNIDQTRIDDLMAELNSDYATHNVIFCANPATFYEDAANYAHNENTEEVSLKTTYNVNPTEVINIYVCRLYDSRRLCTFSIRPYGRNECNWWYCFKSW